MAKKKTRRVPQRSSPRLYSTNPPASGEQPASQSGKTAAASYPAARSSASGARTVSGAVRPDLPLAVEYKYVAGDLRRLGLTALSFFALLISAGVIAYFVQR
jgi:hypothetical protein